MAVTVPLGVPLFALAFLSFGGVESVSSLSIPELAWMALAGVVHFVIGRYGNYRATRALGATLSSPITQLSVPISLLLALIYLGETLTPLKFAGFVLVMVGPLLAMRRCVGAKAVRTQSGFKPRYGEGIFWGAVCALGYGASPLFIVKGLGADGGLVESLAGGFVSYTAAAIVIIVIVFSVGGASFMRQIDHPAGKWFLVSGVLVFVSQMFRYMALSVAPVSIVVPIQRLSVIFRVVFSWLLNRDHEVFGFAVLLGIALSLVGAIGLTLSADMVASILPLEWASFLTLKWPNMR